MTSIHAARYFVALHPFLKSSLSLIQGQTRISPHSKFLSFLKIFPAMGLDVENLLA